MIREINGSILKLPIECPELYAKPDHQPRGPRGCLEILPIHVHKLNPLTCTQKLENDALLMANEYSSVITHNNGLD